MKNTLGLFVDEALPVQTDGQCDILEIPLTVTYLTQGHGNAGAFVSGGLLSYHIFREVACRTLPTGADNYGRLRKVTSLFRWVTNRG